MKTPVRRPLPHRTAPPGDSPTLDPVWPCRRKSLPPPKATLRPCDVGFRSAATTFMAGRFPEKKFPLRPFIAPRVSPTLYA